MESSLRLPSITLVLCLLTLVVCVASFFAVHTAASQSASETSARHKYTIQLDVDFDSLSYSGAERVRWINHGEKSSSVIYLHLYPNLRTADQPSALTATPTLNSV